LISRYDSPEARALFHRHCHNLQGKIRLERTDYAGLLGHVKSGVKQIFERIDLEGSKGMGPDAAVEEVEKRLEWFTKKVSLGCLASRKARLKGTRVQTIPALLRSAVSRENTLVVVPSYFDFIRVVNHLRKTDVVSFAAISEYVPYARA
jgi:U3 small nucleolar RNA-associated protein 25